MSIEIVIPTLEQARELTVDFMRFYGESQWSDMPFDLDRIDWFVKFWLDNPDWIYCRVALHNGQPVGVMGGEKFTPFFTSSPITHDYLLYVYPEKRGLAAGYYLLQDFLRWSFEEVGAHKVLLVNTTGIVPESVERLYQRVGGERVGGSYYVSRPA